VAEENLVILLQIPLFLAAIALFILVRRGKLKAEELPVPLAIGIAVYIVVASMAFFLVLEPGQGFMHSLKASLGIALAAGIVAYLVGLMIIALVRRRR
jgi:ABC-type Fe3+ transport system permease subunit